MIFAVKASTDAGPLANPTPLLEPPPGALGCVGYGCAKWLAGGLTNADETFDYQIIGWLRALDATVSAAGCWVPTLLAKGTATLGAGTYTVTSLGAAARLWADGLSITNATKYSVVTTHVGNEAIAVVETNLQGFTAVSVDTDLTGAASADVLVHLEREASPAI